jgi:aldehyde oxidoreductase
MGRMTTRPATVDLVVNGTPRRLDIHPDQRLLDLLRDGLELTGAKEGCEDGTCGTCTVLVDGKMVRACRMTAGEAAGREVMTIEGLGTTEHPHRLQEAFVAADAVQCGFCTPGMIMAAAALLERNARPSRDEISRWLGSNLCRCTGYQGIVDAIEWAADGRDGPPRRWPAADGVAPCDESASPDRVAPAQAAGIRRADAMDKATGRAMYAADLTAEGMLHGAVLRSPHPHADIVRIDTERARSMPGVAVVLTAADVPGINSYGRKIKDEPVLAESRVRKVGDPVALVVAASRAEAETALAAIKVDYVPLPALFDPEDALADGAPAIHPGGNLVAENRVRSGDIADGFARADVVVDGTYETTWNEHAYLEPEAVLAAWEGETLIVRTPTQYAHYQRTEVARTLGLPVEKVRIATTVVGGGFGGKTEITCQCLAALGTWHTGRPVRIVYGRQESFLSSTKRHPFRIRIRTGVTRDGDLTALQVELLADTGAYASFGPGIMVKTFGSAAGPYRWPAVELHGRVAFTNNPTCGAMRGPGTTQAAFALESHLDRVAARVGMDPLDFRERNRLRKGDRLLSGQVLDRDPAYPATIEAIRPHWREALERCAREGVAGAAASAAADAGAGAARDAAIRRGVGIASVWYGIGGGGGGPMPGMDPAATVGRGPGRAAIDLLPDGSIAVRTGAMDLGQGAATVMRLIAAEEVGVPIERVQAHLGDTATGPDAGPTVGSRVTFFVGNAVRNAAADLREAILGTASGLLARPVGEIEIRDGDVAVREDAGGVAGGSRGAEDDPVGAGDGARGASAGRVSLADIARARHEAGRATSFDGFFDVDLPAFDPRSGLGEPYAMYVTGTQMAEVEVDTRTGAVRVIRVVAAHDVGRPVFLEGLTGQIEGGIAMGVGFALTEEFVPGETRGFRDYRIPRTRDVPEMVTILVADPGAPPEQQAKGVAECSNMVAAPAIANAVAHATGRRVTRLPIRLDMAD